MLSDALSAAAVTAIPVLAIAFGTEVLSTLVLAALAALGNFFDPAGMTARQSMLPEAAERAGWTRDHTNSVYEAVFNLAYITGPGIGGLLIATLGGINTMWVTAALFGLAILTMAVLRLEGTGRPAREKLPENMVSGVLEGLKFVWHNRVLRTLGLIDLAVTGLYLPMESVLFPKYFTDRNEPAHLGWVLMALSIGGLIGALSWTVLSKFSSKRATVLTAVLTFGIAVAIIGFLPPLPVILSFAVVVGLVYGPIGPIYNSIMQNRTPEHLRGRVVGVMTSMTYAAGPIGFMLAGPLVDAFGLKVTFLALAIPILVIGLLCPWLPALRELDDEPEAQPAHA
jgi:predicted MFS family arabinose efflux permease